jgi:ribonuclease HI
MESYYVVKRGHKPGIYKTWAECKAAVDGFKNPIFKKFGSFEEANTFYKAELPVFSQAPKKTPSARATGSNHATETIDIRNGGVITGTLSSLEMERIRAICTNIKSAPFSADLNYNVNAWNVLNDEIYIFTDGSSKRSQNGGASVAGLGVYLGAQCTNIKETYQGRTNNQCELGALDYAFKLIIRYHHELSEMGKTIKIVSDSEYSIKAVSLWLAAWKKNGWRTSGGEPVKNKELIESIDASMQRIKVINATLEDAKKIRVKLIHVNSHQVPDTTDKFKYSIWFGNYVADGLAQNTI